MSVDDFCYFFFISLTFSYLLLFMFANTHQSINQDFIAEIVKAKINSLIKFLDLFMYYLTENFA